MQLGMIDFVLGFDSVECLSEEYVRSLLLKQDSKSLAIIGMESRAISKSVNEIGMRALGKRGFDEIMPECTDELNNRRIRRLANSTSGWRDIQGRFQRAKGVYLICRKNMDLIMTFYQYATDERMVGLAI